MTKILSQLFIIGLILFSMKLDATEGSLQVRGAAFFPLNHRFQDIYGTAGNFQAEGALALSEPIELWGNIDWLTKETNNDCCKSRLYFTNFSLGLKHYFSLNDKQRFYAGLGPAYGKMTLHNKTCCEKETRSKYAFGIVVKSGMQYAFTTRFYADLFIDYLYQPIRYQQTVDVGGFKLGLGLGMQF